MLVPWQKSYDQLRQHIKKQRHYFANNSPYSQSYGSSHSHVWMWELGYKKSWAPKNCCFWTVVLEKTLESPLDCKVIQPVHPKGDQSWMYIGRTDAEAETPVLWPPDEKNWLLGKDPNAGKDWRQEEKGMTEDEMAGWYHRLDGHEFEWSLGVGDGQGGLACCNSWGRKESDTTEWLNWTSIHSAVSVGIGGKFWVDCPAQLNAFLRLRVWILTLQWPTNPVSYGEVGKPKCIPWEQTKTHLSRKNTLGSSFCH